MYNIALLVIFILLAIVLTTNNSFFNSTCLAIIFIVVASVVFVELDEDESGVDISLKINMSSKYGGAGSGDLSGEPDQVLDHTHDPKIVGGAPDFMKMELMDPKHNIREIAKQLILLEDHMAHKHKRCVDCITKHYLMVEGLLEEAVTLDKKAEHVAEVNKIMQEVKPVMMNIIYSIKNNKINDDLYHKACQSLRQVRKQIGLKYVLNN